MLLRWLHRCAAAAVLACALPDPSAAAAPTVWLCGLSGDLVRIVCVADVDAAQVGEPPRPTARVHGTSFPLDPRRQWTVDLWSPATEPDRVAELARATLCYRTPDCEVVMNTAVLTPDPPRPAAWRR